MWKKRSTKTLEDLRKAAEEVNVAVEPCEIPDMDKAADILLSLDCLPFGDDGDVIHILGDYDCDGVSGMSILQMLKAALGFTWQGLCLAPHRKLEGYGANNGMIGKIMEDDEKNKRKKKVVIFVDNGITCFEQVKTLKDNGYTVIILDHHELSPSGDVPNADIIIDPAAFKNAAYNNFCGAGLAWKLVEAVNKKKPLDADMLNTVQVYAAWATIADVVELSGENRLIVKNGLKIATDSSALKYAGCLGFLKAVYCSRLLTEYDVAFTIGPVINAWSRMGNDVSPLVEILTSRCSYSSGMLEKIIATNAERKDAQNAAIKAAEDQIYMDYAFDDCPLVIALDGVETGLVGIVAGRLCEKYKVPTLVMTKDGEFLKGSGRAPEGFSLKGLIDRNIGLFEHAGGHDAACGFAIEASKLAEVKEKLQADEESKKFVPESADDIYYDVDITEADLPEVYEILSTGAPYGNGNIRPSFRIDNVQLSMKGSAHFDYCGNEKQHVKMYGKNNLTIMGFGLAEKFRSLGCPQRVSLIGEITPAHYQYSKDIFWQMQIADFEAVKDFKKVTPLRERLLKIASE